MFYFSSASPLGSVELLIKIERDVTTLSIFDLDKIYWNKNKVRAPS